MQPATFRLASSSRAVNVAAGASGLPPVAIVWQLMQPFAIHHALAEIVHPIRGRQFLECGQSSALGSICLNAASNFSSAGASGRSGLIVASSVWHR